MTPGYDVLSTEGCEALVTLDAPEGANDGECNLSFLFLFMNILEQMQLGSKKGASRLKAV